MGRAFVEKAASNGGDHKATPCQVAGRLVERLRPALDDLSADIARLQEEVDRTHGLLGKLGHLSNPGSANSRTMLLDFNDTSSMPLEPEVHGACATGCSSWTGAPLRAPHAVWAGELPASEQTPDSTLCSRMVVLNCANIGCMYAECLRHGSGSTSQRVGCKFSWEGIRQAFRFYDESGMLSQGVCKNRTAVLSPVPADLKARVIVCPVVDDHGDADDLFTIRLAMHYGCQFVDNDNYRDWKHQPDKWGTDEDVRSWLQGEGARLKVPFVFDRTGRFIPLIEP